MVRVVPVQEEHFDGFEPKGVFEHADAVNYARLCFHQGVTMYSLIAGGKVVGIVGAMMFHSNVAEVFGLYTCDISKWKVSFHKAIKKVLKQFFADNNLHRMQMVVRADYEQGQRWAESLGFEIEGIMRKYGPTGLDYFMYGRVN